jgi:hypothetical protein
MRTNFGASVPSTELSWGTQSWSLVWHVLSDQPPTWSYDTSIAVDGVLVVWRRSKNTVPSKVYGVPVVVGRSSSRRFVRSDPYTMVDGIGTVPRTLRNEWVPRVPDDDRAGNCVMLRLTSPIVVVVVVDDSVMTRTSTTLDLLCCPMFRSRRCCCFCQWVNLATHDPMQQHPVTLRWYLVQYRVGTHDLFF